MAEDRELAVDAQDVEASDGARKRAAKEPVVLTAENIHAQDGDTGLKFGFRAVGGRKDIVPHDYVSVAIWTGADSDPQAGVSPGDKYICFKDMDGKADIVDSSGAKVMEDVVVCLWKKRPVDVVYPRRLAVPVCDCPIVVERDGRRELVDLSLRSRTLGDAPAREDVGADAEPQTRRFKAKGDFRTQEEWGTYLRDTLKPGMRIRVTGVPFEGSDKIRVGDMGTVRMMNGNLVVDMDKSHVGHSTPRQSALNVTLARASLEIAGDAAVDREARAVRAPESFEATGGAKAYAAYIQEALKPGMRVSLTKAAGRQAWLQAGQTGIVVAVDGKSILVEMDGMQDVAAAKGEDIGGVKYTRVLSVPADAMRVMTEQHDFSLAAPSAEKAKAMPTPKLGAGIVPVVRAAENDVNEHAAATETAKGLVTSLPGIELPEDNVGFTPVAVLPGKCMIMRAPGRIRTVSLADGMGMDFPDYDESSERPQLTKLADGTLPYSWRVSWKNGDSHVAYQMLGEEPVARHTSRNPAVYEVRWSPDGQMRDGDRMRGMLSADGQSWTENGLLLELQEGAKHAGCGVIAAKGERGTVLQDVDGNQIGPELPSQAPNVKVRFDRETEGFLVDFGDRVLNDRYADHYTNLLNRPYHRRKARVEAPSPAAAGAFDAPAAQDDAADGAEAPLSGARRPTVRVPVRTGR